MYRSTTQAVICVRFEDGAGEEQVEMEDANEGKGSLEVRYA